MPDKKEFSLDLIKFLISKDRKITIRLLTDDVLAKNKKVLIYLKELSNKTNHLARKNYLKLKKEIREDSIYKDELEKIEYLVNKNQYLSSLNALEIIGYNLKN
jgi:hypothetical protein